jgi:regulator of sirC expression with transglutaminase-like and TPR domain
MQEDPFLEFCARPASDLDLEAGVFLLATTNYPDLDIPAYRKRLDSYASDLHGILRRETPLEESIASLNNYLFARLGFKGNHEDYYDPDNSYFNQVLDRRKGIPITLSALYLFLSARLSLPVVGIGMPGHFICGYELGGEMRFIDPFNGGKILTGSDCLKYLNHSREGFKESYLAPVNSRTILRRMCANLHAIYRKRSLPDKTGSLEAYISALDSQPS